MLIVLKLGGSIITQKYRKEFPLTIEEIEKQADNYINYQLINGIASVIAKYSNKISLVLTHGAGQFGHYLATKYLEGMPITPKDIHKSVAILNKKVTQTLSEFIDVRSISPFETVTYTGDSFLTQTLVDKIKRLLEQEKIPIIYGDVVKSRLTTKYGKYWVFSGDDAVLEVSKKLKANIAAMATDVDGVFTKDPKIYPDAKFLPEFTNLMEVAFHQHELDVTGGMKKKVEILLQCSALGAKAYVFDGRKIENYRLLFDGKPEGTTIKNLDPDAQAKT